MHSVPSHPHRQAVYTALKETEQRATDLLPFWKVGGGLKGALMCPPTVWFARSHLLAFANRRNSNPPPLPQFPILAPLIPRQRKALAAVELIRDTTNTLIK
jgi:carotene epsilon-monooxygenase